MLEFETKLSETNPKIFWKIKGFTPLIYIVCEEEYKLLQEIQNEFKSVNFMKFYYHSSTTGMVEMDEYLKTYGTPSLKSDNNTIQIAEALNKFIANDITKYVHWLIINEADIYANGSVSEIFSRKIKDVMNQTYIDDHDISKYVILLSSKYAPIPKLLNYMDVCYYNFPNEKEVSNSIEKMANKCSRYTSENEKEIKEKQKVLLKEHGQIVKACSGMSMFSIQKILLNSYSNGKDFKVEQVIDFKKELLKKTNLLEFIETDVSFDDIGGLDKLKTWLKKMSGGWTEEGVRFGLQPLKGMLLVGVPGTGKSLICKSLANEYKIPLIKFDPSKLFSSRIGDSEANMHMALNLIESQAPCVLFIDEIEKAFAGIHSSTFSDAGTTARVIGVYLTWMQECKKPIFTVATSNMIQYLPPELVSRFDETFFVNIPNENEREMIFRIHLNKALNSIHDSKYKFNIEKDCAPLILAINSKDLTGREIEQVIKESMYEAYNSKGGPTKLNDIIITNILKNKIPIIKSMDNVIEYLIKWVGYDKDKKDGIRARFANGGEKEWNNLNEFINIMKSSRVQDKNDDISWGIK